MHHKALLRQGLPSLQQMATTSRLLLLFAVQMTLVQTCLSARGSGSTGADRQLLRAAEPHAHRLSTLK